jgi:hypothetical protein
MPWPEIAGRQPAVSQMLDVGARHIVDFPLVVLCRLLLVQWLAAWLADAFRSRMRPLKELEREDYGIVLTASLTLLGLIIAFSFSMAVSRYDQRKKLRGGGGQRHRDGVCPGRSAARADAARVRELLRRYLDQRILFYTTRDGPQLRRIDADTTQLQSELWSTVRATAAAQPTPLTALAISGMNDVLNSQGYTQAAWWNRIPSAAWGLMAAIAVFCNLLHGYHARTRDALLFLVLPLSVSISFFLIADIDSPRGGLIRVLPQNLLHLAQSLR